MPPISDLAEFPAAPPPRPPRPPEPVICGLTVGADPGWLHLARGTFEWPPSPRAGPALSASEGQGCPEPASGLSAATHPPRSSLSTSPYPPGPAGHARCVPSAVGRASERLWMPCWDGRGRTPSQGTSTATRKDRRGPAGAARPPYTPVHLARLCLGLTGGGSGTRHATPHRVTAQTRKAAEDGTGSRQTAPTEVGTGRRGGPRAAGHCSFRPPTGRSAEQGPRGPRRKCGDTESETGRRHCLYCLHR